MVRGRATGPVNNAADPAASIGASCVIGFQIGLFIFPHR